MKKKKPTFLEMLKARHRADLLTLEKALRSRPLTALSRDSPDLTLGCKPGDSPQTAGSVRSAITGDPVSEEDDFINRVLKDVARQEAGGDPSTPSRNLASLSDEDMENFIRTTAKMASKYNNRDKNNETHDCGIVGTLGPFFVPIEKRLHAMAQAMPGVAKTFVDRVHAASDCEVSMLTIAVESTDNKDNNIVPGMVAPMEIIAHATNVIRDTIEHMAAILTAAAGASEHKDFFMYEQFMLKAQAAKLRMQKNLTPGELKELGLSPRDSRDDH